MAQQMAIAILRDGRAEMRTDPPENKAGLFLGIPVPVYAANDQKTAPAFQLVTDLVELCGKSGERKVVLAEVWRREFSCLYISQRFVQFLLGGIRKLIEPIIRVSQVGSLPGLSRENRRFWHLGRRMVSGLDLHEILPWSRIRIPGHWKKPIPWP